MTTFTLKRLAIACNMFLFSLHSVLLCGKSPCVSFVYFIFYCFCVFWFYAVQLLFRFGGSLSCCYAHCYSYLRFVFACVGRIWISVGNASIAAFLPVARLLRTKTKAVCNYLAFLAHWTVFESTFFDVSKFYFFVF